MTFPKEIRIEGKVIREGSCFIIAEGGVNHNGDLSLAKKLADAAKEAGADAIKFQTFLADEEVTRSLKKVEYQKQDKADQESYHDMIKRLEFTEAEWKELKEYCETIGITFLSTPSEEVSARFLEKLGVPAYKLGSNDLVTTPMLEEIASWHKPTILSTGMATLDEIQEALDIFVSQGNSNIVLLHCTSSYPTPLQDLNLSAIQTLQGTFGTLVGFSDHSGGVVAAPLAVLLGACIVETHITLDKNLPGPDQKMALEPNEFKTLVAAIRSAEKKPLESRQAAIDTTPNSYALLGNPEKKPTDAELVMRIPTRKSIVARRLIRAGETIQKDMLAYKRPYSGLPARRYKDIVGKKVLADIAADEHIEEKNLA